MNSPWEKLYDRSKDRKYALLFTVTILISFGLGIAAARIMEAHPGLTFANLWPFLAALPPILIALSLCAIHQFKRRHSASAKCPPLSSDECRVARSKLRNGVNGFKSVKPVERPPDLDLKM